MRSKQVAAHSRLRASGKDVPDGSNASNGLGPRPPFLRDIPVKDLIDAKVHTAELLSALGIDESDQDVEAEAARSVFRSLTSTDTPEATKRAAVALLETPESVRHLVAMLTVYDYDLIQHATEIRTYLTATLLDDVDHPDPRVRHKAIELAGKIAGIGLFEERVALRRVDMSDDELNEKIRDRMDRIARLQRPLTDTQPVDVKFVEKAHADPLSPTTTPPAGSDTTP